MQIFDWNSLDAAGRAAALARPREDTRAEVLASVTAIVERVRRDGDAAVRAYTQQFDQVALGDLRVTAGELAAAAKLLSSAQRAAIVQAIDNVRRFHEPQIPPPLDIQIMPGVRCERVIRPIPSVGLYIPAGVAPLPSTVVMLAVPAALAGCPQRVLCTAPRPDGSADPAVLAAAQLCGIDTIFRIGGAQAIAAMAYGTQTIPKVDKIFGPGSVWVTAAKQLVAADPQGAACDLPAGPSEVLVLADETARAQFVAADLLAQAEHDTRAQALLVTTSLALAQEVAVQLRLQLQQRSRSSILVESMRSCRALIVTDLATAMDVSNAYAPEHLIIETAAPRDLLPRVQNAGSVFLGEWSPEPMGDYCSGTNHVLPTYGYARAHSGLSVLDFIKHISVQELTAEGLQALGPVAATLAGLEGLDAHAAAVNLRLAVLCGRSAS